MDIRDKLLDIEARYEQLSESMSQPQALADRDLMTAYAASSQTWSRL